MSLLWGTFSLRPYVFIFLLVYLLIAVSRMGWARSVLFTLIGFSVAYVCESSSIINGFPFGLYHYIDATRSQELWLGGVPFFDSLSFSFLSYVGYHMALMIHSKLQRLGWDIRIIGDRAIAYSWRVTITGALLMALLDVVIDPLTLQGDKWFLGKLYYYPHGGTYFGVPISNFLGWFFVGFLTIRIFQVCNHYIPDNARWNRGHFALPGKDWMGLGLYYGILSFNLVMTGWIGDFQLLAVGCMIYLPLTYVLCWHVKYRLET